ncbi:MAG: DUF1499 domain-containing protein [Nitrospinae bacterium]|nr:DUF1499 domain-containing protein [Nitrospinota bacterium]
MANKSRALSSISYLGLFISGACALAAVASGLGHRWGLWHFSAGFQIFKAASVIALLSVVISMAGGLFALRDASRLKTLAAALGIALGFIVAGFLHAHMQIARRVPKIHDITTDTRNPPVFQAVLPLRKGAQNPPAYEGARIARLQKKAYPNIKPLTFRASKEEVFGRALDAARAMGWHVVSSKPDEGRIEAYDATFWYGFIDDIVIRIRSSSGTTRLDIRSKSRVGVGDIGENARRIRGFFEKLKIR